MAKANEVYVGQRWAYCATENKEPVEVEVTAVAATGPRRVKVKFLAGQKAGVEELLSPARLKVLWSDRVSYFETEAQWRALASKQDGPDGAAVDIVLDLLVREAAVLEWRKGKQGTIAVRDAARVDAAVGGGLDELLSATKFIVDSEGTHYGWSVALDIAQKAASFNSQRVMAYVHAEEAEGKRFTSGYYEEYTRPVLELLREWCGEEAVAFADELLDATTEARRLSGLLIESLAVLFGVGAPETSWELYKRFDPSVSKRDWHVFMALELKGDRPMLR